MNKIVKNALILMAITLVSGTFLGAVYEITKEPIAVQQEIAKEKAYQAVYPEAASLAKIEDKKASMDSAVAVLEENHLSAERINEVLLVQDEAGNGIGVVMNVTTTEGYGGDITFTMGIQNDGTVKGIEVLKISETAGLGMKAAEDDFKTQFKDKKVEEFTYSKTGAVEEQEIDAISGATITTSAVTNGVNAGICFFESLKEGGLLNE